MPLESIRVSSPLPASAARVYAAWLDSREHSLMTGSAANVEPRVGGRHAAWDGYIEGVILELEPGERIVQTWRSSEFPAGHPHSRLEIRLRDAPGGCEISLAHSEIPEGQAEQYEAGWQEHYFIPMTKYFRETPEAPREEPVKAPAPPKKATPKKGVRKAAPKKAALKKAAPRKAAKRVERTKSVKAVKAKTGAKKKPVKAKKGAARPAPGRKTSGARPSKKGKKGKPRAGARKRR